MGHNSDSYRFIQNSEWIEKEDIQFYLALYETVLLSVTKLCWVTLWQLAVSQMSEINQV